MKNFRGFLLDYWNSSSDELERWEEKVDKLPYTDTNSLYNAIEEYAKKEATKLSIEFTIENLKELSSNPHIGNFEDSIIQDKIKELQEEYTKL